MRHALSTSDQLAKRFEEVTSSENAEDVIGAAEIRTVFWNYEKYPFLPDALLKSPEG